MEASVQKLEGADSERSPQRWSVDLEEGDRVGWRLTEASRARSRSWNASRALERAITSEASAVQRQHPRPRRAEQPTLPTRTTGSHRLPPRAAQHLGRPAPHSSQQSHHPPHAPIHQAHLDSPRMIPSRQHLPHDSLDPLPRRLVQLHHDPHLCPRCTEVVRRWSGDVLSLRGGIGGRAEGRRGRGRSGARGRSADGVVEKGGGGPVEALRELRARRGGSREDALPSNTNWRPLRGYPRIP